MVREATKKRTSNGKHTLVLPITEEHYTSIIDDPKRLRSEWLEPMYIDCPELFPPGFDKGYEMAGHYTSKRQNIKIRRITLLLLLLHYSSNNLDYVFANFAQPLCTLRLKNENLTARYANNNQGHLRQGVLLQRNDIVFDIELAPSFLPHWGGGKNEVNEVRVLYAPMLLRCFVRK